MKNLVFIIELGENSPSFVFFSMLHFTNHWFFPMLSPIKATYFKSVMNTT
jgi:hypothetical protein